MILVAIDPGVNGGIAWRNAGKIYAVKMPPNELACVEQLVAIFNQVRGNYNEWVELYLEDPPLFTGRLIPGSAVGKLHRNFGVLLGASYALGFKVKTVRPQDWQAAFDVGKKGKQSTSVWKNVLKSKAEEIYPDGVPVTLWSADALLLLDAATKKKV